VRTKLTVTAREYAETAVKKATLLPHVTSLGKMRGETCRAAS